MIRIITTKRLRRLERIERAYEGVQIRYTEALRWLAFWHPIEPVIHYLYHGFHQIDNVRREFRQRVKSFDWQKDDGGI